MTLINHAALVFTSVFVAFLLYALPTYTESADIHETKRPSLLFGVVASTQCPNDCVEITNTFFSINNDYLNNIATAMNVDVELKAYSNIEALFNAVEQQEVIGAVGFSRSQQRENRFLFSEPFFTSQIAVWYSDKKLVDTQPSAIHWTCVQESSYCKQLEEAGAVDIYYAKDLADATASIHRGKSNAVISSFVVLSTYLDQRNIVSGMLDTPEWVKQEQVGLITARENTWLIDAVNKVLKLEKSGNNIRSIVSQNPYHSIERKLAWFMDEKGESSPITYSASAASYPLLFRNEDGSLDGFLYDFFELLESRSGLQFEYQEPSLSSQGKLSGYTADIVPVAYTEKKSTANWQLTAPFMTLKYVALTQQGESLQNHQENNIGILSSTGNQGLVHLVGWQEKKVTQYTDLISMMNDLLNGRIAVGYVPQEFVHALLLRADVGDVAIGESPSLQVHLALATKHNPQLNTLLNSLFTSIDQNELQKLMRSHRNFNLVYGYSSEEIWYVVLSVAALLILVVTFAYFFISNLQLKVELAESNADQEEKDKEWLKSIVSSLDSWVFIHDKDNKLLLSNCSKYLNGQCSGCGMCNQIEQTPLVDNAIELNSVLKGVNIADHHEVEQCRHPLTHVYRRRKAIRSIRSKSRYVLTILSDVTEQKQRELDLIAAREEAQQAVVARERFLATMSHELRTPIAAIQGLLELMSRHDHGKSNELLLQAQQSTKHLNVLVDEVLDFSKLNANQLVLNPVEVNVLELVCATIRSFENTAKAKALSYQVDVRPFMHRFVWLDDVRLVQIMNNLLSNAIKFTQQGYVKVEVSVADTELKLIITDTGIGMTTEQLKTVFTPFTQADAGVTRQYGGTGLGLSIVDKLVACMGGEFTAESIVNVGTTFTIHIPIKAAMQLDQSLDSVTYCSSLPVPLQQWCRNWGMSLVHDSPDLSLDAQGTLIVRRDCHVLAQLTEEQYRYPSVIQQSLMGNIFQEEPKATMGVLHGKVLVAEDNMINQNIIRMQLAEMGVQNHIVSNGEQALEYLEAHNDISLLLTDFHMPVMDGFALTCALKAKPEWRFIPVIGLTAEDSRVASQLAEESGLDAVLCKPYTMHALEQVMAQYLSTNVSMPAWLCQFSSTERQEFANIFIQSMSQDLHTLRHDKAVTARRKALHSIKGALASVGLTDLSEAFGNAEREPESELGTIIPRLACSLSEEIESIIQWVEKVK